MWALMLARMKDHEDIESVLIAEDVILRRLDEVAEKIVADYAGRPILMIGIMKGALVFMSDLFRRLPVPVTVECITASSYYGGTETTGEVTFHDAPLPDVKGQHVLLVDDILDTGLTLHAVSTAVLEGGASSVKRCVLLDKDKERSADVTAEYSCFRIANEFVVGYGLDYNERYRNLPFVGILKPEVIARD